MLLWVGASVGGGRSAQEAPEDVQFLLKSYRIADLVHVPWDLLTFIFLGNFRPIHVPWDLHVP